MEAMTANSTPQTEMKAGVRAVKVLITDYEPAFRERLKRVLAPQRRIIIIGEAENAAAAAECMETCEPDVVLVNYDSCRQMAGVFRKQKKAAAVIVTLSSPEKTTIIDSFRFGARGIILKDSQARIWWKGISAVLAGQYWLGNESLAVLIQAIRESAFQDASPQAPRHFGLTPREIEIVQKIADGRTNKEVGEHYSIRERTVKHHLTNIFGKVGVSSRLELALLAREHRIQVSPDPADQPAGRRAKSGDSPKQKAGESQLYDWGERT
jgi:DNA-binding NarL/FixJ family response regulator